MIQFVDTNHKIIVEANTLDEASLFFKKCEKSGIRSSQMT